MSTKILHGDLVDPVPSTQIDGDWIDGAKVNNPGAGAALIETAALLEGWYLFGFMLHATVAATFEIRHRNAADNANISAKEVPIPANNLIEPIFPTKIKIAANERIRVANVTLIAGDAQASIFLSRIAG